MHELSVAQDLVDVVTEALRDQGPVRVVRLRLRLGALSGVVAQALHFAYEPATAGTPLEGSTLEIQEVPAAVWCGPCGAERAPTNVHSLRCPVCGTPAPDVVRGRELEVESVEVADAGAPGNAPGANVSAGIDWNAFSSPGARHPEGA